MILSDFCIVDGEYDPEKNEYTSFQIRPNVGNSWGACFRVTRDQVINAIEECCDFEVFLPGENDKMKDFRRLFLVVVDGRRYIRADKQNIAADYI
jgi:hypothetical protein